MDLGRFVQQILITGISPIRVPNFSHGCLETSCLHHHELLNVATSRQLMKLIKVGNTGEHLQKDPLAQAKSATWLHIHLILQ
jgi:chromosome condensin MukBEF MukE localization factor